MDERRSCSRCRRNRPLAYFVGDDGAETKTCSSCRGGKSNEYRKYNFEITVEEPAESVAPDKAAAAPTPPRDVAATQPLPPQPPVDEAFSDPLQSAYHHHAVARDKRDLRREHKALVEENELLKEEISAILKAQQPPEILVYRQPAWERSDAVACATASDWHIEEPVEGHAVHGLNEYNLDIATARAKHFFQNLLRLTDILARETKITTIFLGLLGDFFSGWIHEELIANTLLAPADASLFCKGLVCSGIEYLLRESSYVIDGECIIGNHGRLTEKMHFGDPTGTSLEKVMYHGVLDRFRDNPRVRIRCLDQAMVFRTFFERYTVRYIHGYEVKYNGGVGGLTIPLNKAIAQWDKAVPAKLTVLGHYHQFFDGGNFLVNGSLIGYNLYAQNIKAAYEDAQQAFYLVHAHKGGSKSIVAPIWLDADHHQHTDEIVQAQLGGNPTVLARPER